MRQRRRRELPPIGNSRAHVGNMHSCNGFGRVALDLVYGQGKRSCANGATTLRPNGLLACASSLIP